LTAFSPPSYNYSSKRITFCFFLPDWYVHPVPFLDYDLVDFANQLPARHKLLALDEKHLLKIVDKVRE